MPPTSRFRRRCVTVLALCLLVLAAVAGAQELVLSGHLSPRVHGATLVERAPADEKVDLALVVNLDQALLDRTLAGLYGPGAPKNKAFLTPAQFAQTFGFAQKRQALKDFARASGLSVPAEDSPFSQVVRVTGSAAAVEKAFGVRLQHYRTADGRTFRANDGEPSIPTALAPHLRAVLGLSNFRGARTPHLRRHRPDAAATGAARPATLTGTGPGGGLAPADIKSIYGLKSGVLTGTGQTVALVELDGYNAADVNLYEQSLFPTPYPTASVNCTSADSSCGQCVGSGASVQNQACSITTPEVDGGMVEVALDIDMMIALSSGTSIKVYTALNQDPNDVAVYSDVAADASVSAVSTSWGLDEQDEPVSDMTTEHSIFQQMAAEGKSMFSSAGDSGAYDASGAGTGLDAVLLTDDPASQPYVTAVGGTSLSGTIASHTETVWNNGCTSGDPGADCSVNGAGGGGVANYASAYWPLPSYQNGVTTAYSAAFRNVPDVSLNADPNSAPYAICVGGTCNNCTGSSCTTLIGGTSAASPLWAGLAALVDQQRASKGYSTLGFANPSLYALAGNSVSYGTAFNDVTSGNNGFYSAGTGYDNASGWGSFKANALIAQLSSPSTATIQGGSAYLVGVSSIEWTWTAAPDTEYDVYYATQPTQILARGIQPPYFMTGLLPDATAFIVVYSTIDSIQGANGLTLSTATYAEAPTAAPAATGFASSATFTYSACPAFPAPASCSGYVVQVAATSAFTGTTFSSATANAGLATLSVTGLSAVSYYARLGTLNPGGAPSYGPSVEFFLNAVVPGPGAPTFPAVSTGAITFQWIANGNPVGMTYTAQVSTASNFTGTVQTQSGTGLTAAFGGLAADTSYYFRVQGSGGPYFDAGPQATLAAAPAAAPPAFVAVGSATLTAQWGAAGNAPDAEYEADLAANAGFSPLASSSVVTGLSVSFAGLASNTAYFARVRALGRTGTDSSYLSLGSTTTLTSAPSFGAQPFSALGTGSFAVAFNANGNPAGTTYVVQASTNSGFATLTSQQSTTGTSAVFSGLWSNATYYVQVAALNSGGSESAFSAPAATATLVGAASAGAAPFGASVSSLQVGWSAAGLAPGTSFYAAASLVPSPFAAIASGVATSSYAVLGGLAANTTYYGEVQALSNSGDPNGAAVALGAGSTLASPVAAASFAQVNVSSVTVAWTSGGAAEGYRVDFSNSPTFATLAVSVTTGSAATSALVSGLSYDTTYYARVGPLNWQGAPNYSPVTGTAVTGAPVFSTGVVNGGNLFLSLSALPAPLVSVTVTIPGGAFPAGTDASAIVGFFGTPFTSLAGAVSSESPITPLGAQAAFCVSGSATCLYSGGPQPNAPVLFSIVYNPALLPPGLPESAIQLMRYDPTAGQWTLVASQDDPSTHVLTAYTQHFSLFAPFFLTPATAGDVADVQIFPQPWELGAPGSQYYASVLTFASLPAGADVKVFTLTGERVWEGTAAGSGVATWDGTNRFGRSAASGTYLVVIQSGGTKRLRRVVLIR